MKLIATEDIAAEPLAELCDELAREHGLSVESSRFYARSIDAPSWVRMVAELTWWQQALAAYASLYIAEVVKEAAKETWRSRTKLIVLAATTSKGIAKFAAMLWRLSSQLSGKTEIMVGIPEPDEHFGVNLQLSLGDQAAMEVELALFVHYLPAIGNLIASHRNAGVRAISGYFLELQSDANLACLVV